MNEADKANAVWCYRDAEGKTEAVLGFGREELLYDIRNYAYIEGHVMQTESAEARHMVQDVGEDGNADRATRVMDLCMAQVKEMLYPFTKNAVSSTEISNQLKEQECYGVVLSLPEDFSQTTLLLLAKLIHEYVVCTAVGDWMSITNAAKAETWMVKAADMERQIRTALHARRGHMRRQLSVF